MAGWAFLAHLVAAAVGVGDVVLFEAGAEMVLVFVPCLACWWLEREARRSLEPAGPFWFASLYLSCYGLEQIDCGVWPRWKDLSMRWRREVESGGWTLALV